MKKALSLLLALALLLALIPAGASAASQTFTLMVYMCGTDLESDGGLATADLREMIASGVTPGGKLTVYVQTGGTKKWSTTGMKNREGERWVLSSDGMEVEMRDSDDEVFRAAEELGINLSRHEANTVEEV